MKTVRYTQIVVNPDSKKTEIDFVKKAQILGFTLIKCAPVDLSKFSHIEGMKMISDNKQNQSMLMEIAHMIDPDVIDYAAVYSLGAHSN